MGEWRVEECRRISPETELDGHSKEEWRLVEEVGDYGQKSGWKAIETELLPLVKGSVHLKLNDSLFRYCDSLLALCANTNHSN
jgi:hypothetical protein